MYTKDKTEQIKARLSPQEKELIRLASEKEGVKMSEFLRNAVLKEAKRVNN